MAGPIDYSLDVQSPFQSALQGYQAGAAIRNDQQQQQMQQAAMAQQQQRQKLLYGLASNPNATADDYAAVMTALPDVAEHLQKAWTTRNTAQQQAHASDLLQWGAAIKSGKPEIAAQAINDRATAMEAANGGQPTQESQALRVNAQVLEQNPQLALGKIQAMLAANPLGKDAAETLSKFGTEQRAAEQAPGALRKVNADASAAESGATTAAVTAKYAEPQALKDLELKGWNVENIKSEIGFRKESSRIAAMTAALAQKKDAREAQELQLKIDAAKTALDEKTHAKIADVQSATSTIDNLLNTVDRIKKNPGLKDVIGSLEGASFYPNQLAAAATTLSPYGLVSSSGDERADAIALIETLGSQAFMSQIPAMKGTGSLSEREGDKLQASLQNLSRKQSEKQFIENLDEVQRLMLKARKTVETRYGIKAAPPDTPAVQTPPEAIDALVSKYLNPRPPGAR